MHPRKSSLSTATGISRLSFMCCLLGMLIIVAGCATATPVGVRQGNPREVQRTLTANVLSSGTLSAPSTQLLNRLALYKSYQKKPAKTIAEIHNGLGDIPKTDRLFALAELSFAFADKSGNRSYYLAAAVYAFGFLFPNDPDATPDSLDPRYRVAVDLYNRGMAEGLTASSGTEVILKAGTYELPFGTLTISLNESEFLWGSYRMENFKQAALLEVRGLRNR